MLSGNGRHRRPRQAPALLVAVGVTGSAIAIPLFAASGASAADGTVWDKVAQCETGASWSADSGDGEYGGLNLSQDDWEAYGGLDYAKSPDLASRNQQIAVAQKLLAAEGVGAWGTCALTSGLSKETGAIGVDTGVAGDSSGSSVSSGLSDLSRGHSSGSSASKGSSDSADSDSDSDSAGVSDSSKSGGSGDAGASDSAADSDGSSAESSSSPSATPSEGSAESDKDSDSGQKSRSADSSVTATPEVGDSDNAAQAEGSWSLVDTGSLGSGRHRGTLADESGTDGTSTASSGRHAASTYTVQEGDSLVSIADSLGLDGGWEALYAENKDAIGADPSNIMAGQTLDTGVQ